MQGTTAPTSPQELIAEMSQRMAEVVQRLTTWAHAEARTLGDLEQQAVRLAQELGNALLAGVCQLAAPASPAPRVACRCGQEAR